MAVITQQFLAAVFTNFVATFQSVFLQSEVGVPDFCEEVTSATEMESYNWLGSGPRMRQWTDERQPNGATSNNFAIRNLDWEASVEIDRNTFEDDKLHLVKPLIAGLAHEAARHPRQLAFSLLIGGFTAKAWDGINYFADHSNGGKVWLNNNLAAVALNDASYGTAIQTLRAALDDRGRPLDPDLSSKKTLLVVGPKNEETARTLLNSEFIASPGPMAGGTVAGTLAANVWRNSASLLVSAYITDHSWFVVHTGNPGARPFIFQWRKKPQMTQLTNPNTSEAVWRRKKFFYGADSRYNVGYGNFAFAVGSQVA